METAIVIVIVVALVALLAIMIVRSESRRLRELRGYAPMDHTAWNAQHGDNPNTDRARTWSTGQWVAFSMLANQPHHHHHRHHDPDDGQSSGSGILGGDSNYGDNPRNISDGGGWDGHRGSDLFGDTDLPSGGDTPNGPF
ncbi:hypothetical protein [Nocardia africana]